MSASDKTILITGANRGIGLGLAEAYLQKGWTVIAAARDVSKIPKLEGKFITIKIDSASLTDAKEAVEELKTKHNLSRLDVVIANAGISNGKDNIRDVDISVFEEVQDINVRGPLVLFQAVYPLLPEGGKFTVISSVVGSNSLAHWTGLGTYGTSKAAVNFLFNNVHAEEPKLTVFTIHPGWVATDMGNRGAKSLGVERAPVEVVDSAAGIVKLVDSATRETHGGFMWHWDGSKGAW